MYVGIVVDPVDQLLELVGDVQPEQGVKAPVDPDDLNSSAVLDL